MEHAGWDLAGSLVTTQLPDSDGPLHSLEHSGMGTAAAQMIIERRTYGCSIRVRVRIKQRFQTHDDTRTAVSALHGVQLDEGSLQRVETTMLVRKTFYSFQTSAGQITEHGGAGVDGFTIEKDQAGATLLQGATELGAMQHQLIAQHVDQRRRRIQIHELRQSVEMERNRHEMNYTAPVCACTQQQIEVTP